jgi:hypothetical protein
LQSRSDTHAQSSISLQICSDIVAKLSSATPFLISTISSLIHNIPIIPLSYISSTHHMVSSNIIQIYIQSGEAKCAKCRTRTSMTLK